MVGDRVRDRSVRGDAALRVRRPRGAGRIKRVARGDVVERVLGVVLIAHRHRNRVQPRRPFENLLAPDRSLPAFLRGPDRRTRELRRRANKLASLRPHPSSPSAKRRLQPSTKFVVSLPKLGAAPNFTDTQDWFNTPGDQPSVDRRAARPRRARRLLDLHVHQLHPHASVRRRACTSTTTGTGSTSSGSRRRSSRSSRRPTTSGRRSTPMASHTRWSRTTATGPGTRTRTSTGRPSTTSTRRARFATPSSAKAGTPRTRRIVRELLTAGRSQASAAADDGEGETASNHIGTLETYLNPQRANGFVQPLTRGRAYVPPASDFGPQRVGAERPLERRLAVDHACRRSGDDHRRRSRHGTSTW